MVWYAPNDCDDNCCEPPCVPPVVTCRKYESYYGGGFEYTITGADYAWIVETCGAIITNHVLTLVSGNASGTFSTTNGCSYCVRARLSGCETLCCDECVPPTCTLSVVQTVSGITVDWSYGSSEPAVSATLNGVDIFSGNFASGTTYYGIGSIPSVITLVVSNDCGKTRTCVFNTPCCWNKEQFRVTISNSNSVSRSCSQTYSPTYAGENQLMGYDGLIEWSDMSILNGTYLFDTDTACNADATEYYVGTVNLNWQWSETVRGPRFAGGIVTKVANYRLEISGVKVYVRENGIYIKLPLQGIVTANGEVPIASGDIDPAYSPTANLLQGYLLLIAFNDTCPILIGTASYPVTGSPTWVVSVDGPGTAHVGPSPAVSVQAPTPAGWCPGFLSNQTFDVTTEYLT